MERDVSLERGCPAAQHLLSPLDLEAQWNSCNGILGRRGETGVGFVGRCGQTGTGRMLTVRRRETVAVDSDGGDGMHGHYNSMNVRLEDVGSKGGQK